MKFDHLNVQVKEVKALPGEGTGVFSGYASTWDRDLYNDQIVKGAFSGTLKDDFHGDGSGIPIHWQHSDDTPNMIIGQTLSAVEDDHGLLITARLDLDIPEGKRAYELLQRGLIHQMSIGYIATQTAFVQTEGSDDPWDGYRELRQIKLFEISLVQIAANQGAEVLEVKAGRAISASNESKIRKAHDALSELLDSITETPDDLESDDSREDGKASEDDAKKSAESEHKDLDPKWAEEFKQISDFLSLAN
jgi:HK97 family phage prohead protease